MRFTTTNGTSWLHTENTRPLGEMRHSHRVLYSDLGQAEKELAIAEVYRQETRAPAAPVRLPGASYSRRHGEWVEGYWERYWRKCFSR